MWILILSLLPTSSALLYKNINDNKNCICCSNLEETEPHIFLTARSLVKSVKILV